MAGQLCLTGIGYYCSGQASPDCQCGCGPGLKHCQHPQQGWLCVSENATIC